MEIKVVLTVLFIFQWLVGGYISLLSPESPQNRPVAASEKTQSTVTEPILSIRLEEFTRGTQRSIEVNAEKTIVRLNDAEETMKTDAKFWKKLREQVQQLPLEKLDKVLVISKKHQVDAALAATLSVVTDDSTYRSPTFDHNAPPAELAAVIDCLYRQIPAGMQAGFGR